MEEKVIENLCQCLGNLCGYEVKCRVFLYKGQKYTIPSKNMIVKTILREVLGRKEKESSKACEVQNEYILPENLRRLFKSLKNKPKNVCC
ncbi:MAG: DUF2703 domain-containing protein [Caldimicrobium sp.]